MVDRLYTYQVGVALQGSSPAVCCHCGFAVCAQRQRPCSPPCALLAAGKLFLVHTKLDGVITFRFAIGATNTQPHHIREAWEVMQQQLDAAPKN